MAYTAPPSPATPLGQQWAVLVESLDLYFRRRIPPGDFLMAVLENNLREAFSRADEESTQLLPALVTHLYNDRPMAAWGSREKVEAWLRG